MDSLRGELFRFYVIFEIVSSDLCLILSNLRAVQSASQSIEKNLPNVLKEGGVKGVLNNVKKTAGLVKRHIPYSSSSSSSSSSPQFSRSDISRGFSHPSRFPISCCSYRCCFLDAPMCAFCLLFFVCFQVFFDCLFVIGLCPLMLVCVWCDMLGSKSMKNERTIKQLMVWWKEYGGSLLISNSFLLARLRVLHLAANFAWVVCQPANMQ